MDNAKPIQEIYGANWAHPETPLRLPGDSFPLKLRYYPDTVLHKKCEPVVYSPEIKRFATEMLKTMVVKRGIGLAANQVGKSVRVFVVDVEWPGLGGLENSKSYVFINPILLSRSAETVQSVEGCLSFPGETQEVPRAKKLVIRALDIEGEPFTLEADGILAVVIQHEFDHIEGHTFVDAKGYLTRSQARKNVAKNVKMLRDMGRA